MKSDIRVLDKTKRCNRRCGSCKYWRKWYESRFNLRNDNKYYCSNSYSDEYMKDKHYYNCCKGFTWADNIIDKNDIIKEEPIKKSKREIFKEHGRNFPCITCRKYFITKECNRKSIDECFDCEEFKCENCTQYGNLDCDGDIMV